MSRDTTAEHMSFVHLVSRLPRSGRSGDGHPDTAAHLVDRVLPRAPVRQPVRQWVLSLPFGLRFAVAFDRELCRQVRGMFMDTVLATLRRGARQQDLAKGQSGAVVIVQRLGGALDLNFHFLALVLHGVFHDVDKDKRGGRLWKRTAPWNSSTRSIPRTDWWPTRSQIDSING